MAWFDVSREQWGAKPPSRAVGSVEPVRLEIHHSASSVNMADPLTTVRAIQRLHMTAGNADVLYHGFITPDGRIVEGRGWGKRINTGLSADSLMVCVLGNFMDVLPTVEARMALRRLRENLPFAWQVTYHGERGAAEKKPTACPGTRLAEWVRLWRLEYAPTPTTGVKEGKEVLLPVLEQGARGGAVTALQALLNAKAGQGVEADGVFGVGTREAVRNVQRFFGVNADGKVGPVTWGLLFL